MITCLVTLFRAACNFCMSITIHLPFLSLGWPFIWEPPANGLTKFPSLPHALRVGMMLNTGVHVIMYCYYAMKTLGRDPWWKKQLTQLQITQFGINIFVGLVWFYWSKESDCSGDIYSIGLTLFANVTFMLLFIEMYKKIHIEKDKIH